MSSRGTIDGPISKMTVIDAARVLKHFKEKDCHSVYQPLQEWTIGQLAFPERNISRLLSVVRMWVRVRVR